MTAALMALLLATALTAGHPTAGHPTAGHPTAGHPTGEDRTAGEVPAGARPHGDPATQTPKGGPQKGGPQNGRRQGGKDPNEIDKLRADLRRPGAEGREARETAVERLLAMPDPEAHRVLSRELVNEQDPDALRLTILRALGRHLLATDSMQFGGAETAARRQIFNSYLDAATTWWGKGEAAALVELRRAARTALQRVPVRELEHSARHLLTAGNCDAPALFACIADLQNLYLGRVLAAHVEAPDALVRRAARASLRLLTFRGREFKTLAEYEEWLREHGEMTYTDIAERAARAGARRIGEVQRERDLARLARARDVVLAYADASPGINWRAIGRETLVADDALQGACLVALRDALKERVPAAGEAQRLAFCRALLERWKQVPTANQARRSLLLEVAAYTARPEEAELANAIEAGLLAQLQQSSVREQIAALRGLRRFPSAGARQVIVEYARRAVDEGGPAAGRIAAALATLSARQAPRWLAPGPKAADKAAWIDLIRAIWTRKDLARLRDPALTLALSPAVVGADGAEQRVPEVFELLLQFAGDPQHDSAFRASCILRLRSWNDPGVIPRRHEALAQLLGDPEDEVRQQAARSLGKLAKVRPAETIKALRARLGVEKKSQVLGVFAETMVLCGVQPQMSERAIGAIRHVLAELGKDGAIPAAHQFREEPLLAALFQIAGHDNAANGPWLAACEELVAFGRRDVALHLLNRQHNAVELAGGIQSGDAAVQARARWAMQLLIDAAMLKPADQWWGSTPELKAEANGVWVAFGALADASVPETERRDRAGHRLLLLEVELVGGHYKRVVERATNWLASADQEGGVRFTSEQQDAVRLLTAEALLQTGKPAEAAIQLAARDQSRALPPRAIAVVHSIAKALVKTDARTAQQLFDRARKATAKEDPVFRERLLDWATTTLNLDKANAPTVLAELRQHEALFRTNDCPADLRTRFEALRGKTE
ncbi:MAG: HEAT repeat domain-containing protein [bacterium]|nr:HEAT repeat domain-containing protein [bacterium]